MMTIKHHHDVEDRHDRDVEGRDARNGFDADRRETTATEIIMM